MSKSPKIKNLSWGKVEVEGYDKIFKDVKLYPGGAKEWDWNETGTHHEPGIQIDDIKELVDNNAEEIILTKGILKRLKTKDETINFLKDKNIPFQILQTKKAVKTYNKLADKKKIGGVFHSTC